MSCKEVKKFVKKLSHCVLRLITIQDAHLDFYKNDGEDDTMMMVTMMIKMNDDENHADDDDDDNES